jgi:hypothetical protein
MFNNPFTKPTFSSSFENAFKNFPDFLNDNKYNDVSVVQIPTNAYDSLLKSLEIITETVETNVKLAAKVLDEAVKRIQQSHATLAKLEFNEFRPCNTKIGGYIFLIKFEDYVYIGYTKEPKKRIWTLKNNDTSFDNSTILFSEYITNHKEVFKQIISELPESLLLSQNIYNFNPIIFNQFVDTHTNINN